MQSDLNARSFTEPVQSLFKSVKQRVQGIHFSQCGQAKELKWGKLSVEPRKPFAFANACCQSPWHNPFEIKEKGLTFKEERVGTMDFIWKSPVPAGPCDSRREWVWFGFIKFPLFVFLLVMGIILYCAIRASPHNLRFSPFLNWFRDKAPPRYGGKWWNAIRLKCPKLHRTCTIII